MTDSPTRIENSKPPFMSRFASGLIDLCLLFLSFWGLFNLFYNSEIGGLNKFYATEIIKLQDDLLDKSDFGKRVYLDENEEDIYSSYIHYFDEESGLTYIVTNKTLDDIEGDLEEEKDSILKSYYDQFINTINTSEAFRNLSFDYRLTHYGICVFSSSIPFFIFLFIIPLLNKRKATLGQFFSQQRLISKRRVNNARWYHLLIRFIIYFGEGCLAFLFLETLSFLVVPMLYLVESTLTKGGRTLHCLISKTQIIDNRTFTPLVNDILEGESY